MSKYFVIIALLLGIGLGYFLYTTSNNESSVVTSVDPTGTVSGEVKKPEEAKEQGVTMEELAKHSTKEDCWLLISGTVYDVSKFIPMHPGKEKILLGCGKDATELFETKAGSGKTHSEKAREFLMTLAIVGKIEK